MGNHLSGIVPVQMHPVEYYLSDLTNTELISFDVNLGSTRFFKVARVKLHQIRPQLSEMGSSSNQYSGLDAPGLGVAKVFVINDPTLPLKAHKEKIDWLREAVKDNPNSLVFIKSIINDKAVVLLRQYIKYNLYDRLSTRPFLTFFEKTWIAYQLLKCCEWIHLKGVCHGDIKLENILITSYLWVLLTDFATYKPVFLPEDNPADFSYFFDTSRRRTCNVAPERFTHENYSQSESSATGYIHSAILGFDGSSSLQPSMDLFSLGCVIAELFTEDSSNGSLFDLSTLLAYRAGERQQHSCNKVIDSIPDKQIRDLVLNLIELDPKERKSAFYHLHALTPSLFPNYFSDLFKFIKEVIKLPPDEKVVKIANSLKSVIPIIKQEDSKGFLLIIVLVTSSLRSMKHLHAKIIGLRLLCDLVDCDVPVLSNYILDRILPYLIVMLRDGDPRVRAEAIDSLTYVLNKVEQVPPSDNNVFPDYILPSLTQMAKDRSVSVRMTLARNLAELSDIASRFLTNSTRDAKHYQLELAVLHIGFQNMVSNLLTDSSSAVKIDLLSSNISKLCKFFGSQKTNEVILSHIFTFLNEKEGFELRCAFFDNIVPIAEFLGPQCTPLLKPFLQQGISDTEETVIFKTITCLSNLTKLELWEKSTVFEVLSEATCLLCHPNVWIRHSLVYFIHLLATQLCPADVYCKIMPLLTPYLVKEIYSLENTDLLMDNLKKPLPRSVFDKIIYPDRYSKLTSHSFHQFLECLKERKRVRGLARSHGQSSTDLTCSLLQLIISQEEEDLSEEQEEKILNLANILRKVHRDSRSALATPSEPNPLSSNIISLNRRNRKTHSLSLSDLVKNYPLPRRNYQTSSGINMNEEWHTMFGSQKDSIETSQEILDVTGGIDKSSDLDAIPVAHEAKESSSLDDSLSIQPFFSCPPCINELNNLINHKKNYFLNLLSYLPSADNEPRLTSKIGSTAYKPKGYLLAHLHEHSKIVNRITTIEPSSLFVTCSSDSTIKIWDSQKIEDRNCMINKSKQTFRLSDSSEEFKGIGYCPGAENLISYTNANSLYILRVDPTSSKVKLEHREKEFCCEGMNSSITDISCVSPFIFTVSTTTSKIRGYDLRQPLSTSPAWVLDVPLSKGLITCIDGNDFILSCGTSRGILINYDLRFTLEASAMHYSKDRKKSKRIMRILLTSKGLYSAVQGNNEVVLWDCGITEKIKSFWASNVPALSQETRDPMQRSVLGLVALGNNENECLLTGGTDRKVRYWDPKNVGNCCLISDCNKSSPWPSSPPTVTRAYFTDSSVTYETRLMEGIQVIQEHRKYRDDRSDSSSSSSPSSSSFPNSSSPATSGLIWEQQAVSLAHRTTITDLAWNNKMNLLISAGSDGCVKVWK